MFDNVNFYHSKPSLWPSVLMQAPLRTCIMYHLRVHRLLLLVLLFLRCIVAAPNHRWVQKRASINSAQITEVGVNDACLWKSASIWGQVAKWPLSPLSPGAAGCCEVGVISVKRFGLSPPPFLLTRYFSTGLSFEQEHLPPESEDWSLPELIANPFLRLLGPRTQRELTPTNR